MLLVLDLYDVMQHICNRISNTMYKKEIYWMANQHVNNVMIKPLENEKD